MAVELNENARELLRRRMQAQPQTLTVDGETYRLMTELANAAGASVPELFRKLAVRYNRASYLEKKMVLHFLTGV